MNAVLRDVGNEKSLADLVSQVVEDGKAYAKAEIDYVKQSATSRIAAIKPAAIMVVIAIFLLQAALTVLVAGLGMALARWLGAAGGLIAGAVIVLAIVASLVMTAISKVKQAL